jgi:hypothetical protein
MKDSNGVPTATISTSVLAAPITTVLTDSNGVPTATVTEYASLPTLTADNDPVTYYISKGGYFIGFFLPTILGALLTIPIRMVDLSIKQFHPFHLMTRRNGVPAHDSLVLQTGGFLGLLESIRSLFDGHALILLSTLLTILSMVLVSLASEAVSLQLHGTCSSTSFKGCAMTLGVFLGPARATMAILGAMVLIVMLMVFFLARYRSGVATNPWSIAGIAALSTNPGLRNMLTSLPAGLNGEITQRRLADALEGKTFRIGYFRNREGDVEYGILIHSDTTARPLLKKLSQKWSFNSKSSSTTAGENGTANTKHHLPFMMLSLTGRMVFLAFLSGLLILILYYNLTTGDTPFERFMDTQTFGVRFVFTLIGMAITLFWSTFFTSESLLSRLCITSVWPPSSISSACHATLSCCSANQK